MGKLEVGVTEWDHGSIWKKPTPLEVAVHGGTSCEESTWWRTSWMLQHTFKVSLTHYKNVLKTMFLYFASSHNASCIFLIAANYWLAQGLQNIAETQAIILKNNCMNYLNIQALLNKQVLFCIKFSTNCCFFWLKLVFPGKTTFLWHFQKPMCKCNI